MACIKCQGRKQIEHWHVDRNGKATRTLKTCPRCKGTGEEP